MSPIYPLKAVGYRLEDHFRRAVKVMSLTQPTEGCATSDQRRSPLMQKTYMCEQLCKS
ncbi:hypothetical protein HETIRDRAFT_310198 [Heterobasidion irregulare TC 32-1]|uniref:Uncharacterized protein n=1 Tax=Heterobasidion irregulare (strain TC 32-1) TaxID=747525 RepID=W4KK42_HETIT|nr:uncharacterized protein HETIRDRAFT_310198 [Heterobasidion irregulare TC 32-1]ETW85411.1 hypothetical protein HETIRDRAFT_310198 [Heterobasidion irregulare TC 32-1]